MSFFSSSLAEEIVTPLKSNVGNERNIRNSSISEYFEDVDADFYKHAGLERYGEESASEPTERELSPSRGRALYGRSGNTSDTKKASSSSAVAAAAATRTTRATAAAHTDDDTVNDENGIEMKRRSQLESSGVERNSNVTTTFLNDSEDVLSHPSRSLYDNWSCDEDYADNLRQYPGEKSKRGKQFLPKFLNRKRNYYVSHQDSPSTSEPSSHPSENKVRRHQNEQEEVDVGWKIMIFFLKSWFVIWVLFAIAAIATSLSHPHHHRKKVLNSQRNREVPFDINQLHDSVLAAAAGNTDLENYTITNNYEMNDEQILMIISEQIITTCSTQNLITEEGRGECQTLCHGHMCCFMDDEDYDDILVEIAETLESEGRKSYGCANDPEKMCAVFAGCEALVEDVDAPFSNTHHANEETKGSERVGEGNNVDTIENSTVDDLSAQQQKQNQPQKQQQLLQQEQQNGESENTILSLLSSNIETTVPPNYELQLISEVITQTCSNENLHTRQGMFGCASLCQQSICCFDDDEIRKLNPNMDLILRMEGVTDQLLNRTAIGTCSYDEEGENGYSTYNRHFCNVHKGCKNLLLFGGHSNPSHSKIKKKPSSSSLSGKGNSPIYLGVTSTKDDNDNEEDGDGNEWRYLITYFFLFGIMIGITTYLLVFNRHASSVTFDIANTLREEGSSMDGYDYEIRQEMTEFV